MPARICEGHFETVPAQATPYTITARPVIRPQIGAMRNGIAPSAFERDVREPASKRLTSLADPNIDWTEIARGFGVPATRADCPESFARALKGALEREGPSLIEAVLE